MNEYELFSQYVGNESELDSLYIKLSTNMDISMTAIRPLAMSMSEQFDRGTPSIIFDFIDGDGDLANHNLPQSGATFYLDIGRNILELKRISLKLTSMKSVTSTSGSERITYRMFFVHSGWDKFIGQTYNRTWGSVCPTVVAKQISEESGWKNFIASPCDSVVDAVQPNWTNAEMLKWITQYTTMGNGKPRYAGRIDGSFVFKSVQSMILDQSKEAIDGKIPILRMEGQDDVGDREDGVKKNHDIPTYFTNYSINENHVETRLAGGGGIKSYTYDSHTDRFMIDSWGVKDLEGLQMSDWTSTDGKLSNSEVYLYNGRGSENKLKAVSKIANAVDDAVELTIVIEGSIDTRTGMMLEIIIPIPADVESQEPYNIMYSGFWMVSGVEHSINFNRSNMTTNVRLIRSGHDSKRLEGYQKTKSGKFVRRDT